MDRQVNILSIYNNQYKVINTGLCHTIVHN